MIACTAAPLALLRLQWGAMAALEPGRSVAAFKRWLHALPAASWAALARDGRRVVGSVVSVPVGALQPAMDLARDLGLDPARCLVWTHIHVAADRRGEGVSDRLAACALAHARATDAQAVLFYGYETAAILSWVARLPGVERTGASDGQGDPVYLLRV